MTDQYWHTSGPYGLYIRATLRTLQFLLAIIVAALYGVDLHNSTRTHTHANSAWVYAEVVAALSILTCAAHCFLTIRHVAWTAIDWVLFFLWVAQVGVFGTIYIGGEENGMVIEGSADVTRRMQAAVWFDIVNMVLWFSTAMSGVVWCCVKRRVTRRADVVGVGELEQSAEKGEMVESGGRDSMASTLGTKGEKRSRSLSTPRNLSQTKIPPPHTASPVPTSCQLSLVYLVIESNRVENDSIR